MASSYSFSQRGEKKSMSLNGTEDEPSSATEPKSASWLSDESSFTFGSGTRADFAFASRPSRAPVRSMAESNEPAAAAAGRISTTPPPRLPAAAGARRDASMELYERVAILQDQKLVLNQDLAKSNAQTARLQRENSTLRATVDKAGEDAGEIERLRGLNTQLAQQIQDARAELKEEKDAKAHLLDDLDDRDRKILAQAIAIAEKDEHLKTTTTALHDMQRQIDLHSESDAPVEMLAEVNRVLDAPVLEVAMRDITVGSARPLNQELAGLDLESLSQTSDGGDDDDDNNNCRPVDDQPPRAESPAPVLHFSKIHPVASCEPDDNIDEEKATKACETLQRFNDSFRQLESSDLKSSDPKSSDPKSGDHDDADPPYRHRLDQGECRNSGHVSWWIAALLYLFTSYCMVLLTSLRQAEGSIWREANADAVALAWAARGGESLWIWLLTSAAGPRLGELPVGFLG